MESVNETAHDGPLGAHWRMLMRVDLDALRAPSIATTDAHYLAGFLQTQGEVAQAAPDGRSGRASDAPQAVSGYPRTLALTNRADALLMAAHWSESREAAGERRIEATVACATDEVAPALAAAMLERVVAEARQEAARAEGAAAVLRVTLRESGPLEGALAAEGFVCQLVEHDLAKSVAASRRAALPIGGARSFGARTASLFFRAYERAFADRPGFPEWPEAQWRNWATDYETFRPDLSHVVVQDAEPRAFLLAAVETAGVAELAQEAWVVQMGVCPMARRQGLGRALLEDLIGRVQGEVGTVKLSVNENNPNARALYASLGFEANARRAVYRLAL